MAGLRGATFGEAYTASCGTDDAGSGKAAVTDGADACSCGEVSKNGGTVVV